MRILAITLALACSVTALAQGPVRQPDLTIDAAARQAVIEGAIKYLNENYVFPETAKKIEAALRERLRKKEYDNITSPAAFASMLTANLREVSHDKHLGVFFTGGATPHPVADRDRYRAMASKRNYGFEKVERLNGNIGYLDLRGFEDAELAGETAAAAMTFLANTDALIVDLRQNGGGQPEMVALLSSYLFDKRTHLNDIYSRADDHTQEFWTKEWVPGKRFGGDKPVYVLTSRWTFSGAEEFTYNLKNLKRATIIGEVTGGGAHPVRPHRINEYFTIGVPFARAINPITKTNWEGTGVTPDVEVPAAQALKTAHLAALKSVQSKATDPQLAGQLKNLIESVQRELDEMRSPAPAQSAAAQPAEQGIALPATPAGKTLGEFIKALNTGNAETMRRFHQEHGGNPENADKDMGLYKQSGGLKVHSVTRATETEIEVLAQQKSDGDWLSFSIEVEPGAPPRIARVLIHPASAPPPATPAKGAPTEKSEAAPAGGKKLSEAEIVSELESYLEKQAAADRFSGAVLVAKGDKPIFKKAYGMADKSAKAANRVDTKFNLGSMNKMFTSVAIAQLAEQGKLSFDDKVGKHLPDYPNRAVAENVTIHHLLTHTSGLGSFWNAKFDEKKGSIRTVADYLSLFVDDPLRFEPGARFEYSNAGFIVLGAIIEKVSGQSYYDYVREHIYKPAGMTNTDCYEIGEKVNNLAMGYTTGDGEGPSSGQRRENTDTRPNRGGPAGGGYSTVEDLLKFSIALRAGKLISAKSLELITTAKTQTGRGGYGYGFGDSMVNGKRFFGHNGGAPGIAAELRIFPELGYTIAVMGNYDPPTLMPIVRKIAETITAE
ncbi:MAG TPA: serine hydrolase [Blastocatellia bacterium]|nr:serine hydrolase [Blastocatellia bacterium]